jgi:hypothetical protein
MIKYLFATSLFLKKERQRGGLEVPSRIKKPSAAHDRLEIYKKHP